MIFLDSWTYLLQVLPPCLIILNFSTFLSSSVISLNSSHIFLNNASIVSISDSSLASSSNRLFFHAAATPPCTYDNTQAIWVVVASLFIFIFKYRRAALMNALISSFFPLNIGDLVTSTLLPCCYWSMVDTCCCNHGEELLFSCEWGWLARGRH